MLTRITRTLRPRGIARRATRGLGIAAGAVALSASFAAAAGAQGIFTWEGLARGTTPAPQQGVTVSAVGNPYGDWEWEATDERAGNPNNASPVDLNCNHTPGGSECGYNNRGRSVSIYSIDPTQTFTLNDGYFELSPYSYKPDFIFAQAYGSTDPTHMSPIFTMGFAPTTTGLTEETFNWTDVSYVQFVPCLYANTGDTSTTAANCLYPYYYDQGAGTFLADDISFNQPAEGTVPEPSSIALLGTGLVGLVPMARRRLRKS